MAFFFGDGFDLYALPADAINGYWDSGTTANIFLASGRFSGSRGINNQGANGASSLVKSSGSNDAVHHLTIAINITGTLTGTANCFYFQFGDGATVQCTVVFQSSGNILLYSGTTGGTLLATYTGAIAANNAWNAFEIEVVINNTTGSFAVRKNGNTVNDFSATALNTRGGTTNNYASRLTIGVATTTSATIDDLLWRSDASSVAWVGDIRCYTRMPSTDAAAAWMRPSTFQMQPYFGATTNQNAGTTARFTPFVSQGGTIGSIIVNLNAGYTGNMKCAAYSSTGGQPTTVLQVATASIVNPVTGANTFTFSPAVSVTKGTQFFVGLCADVTGTAAYAAANIAPYTTAAFSSTQNYSTFPASSPAGLAASFCIPVFPVVTPTYNADAVADVYEDSAASYLSSSNVGDSDLYTLTGISGTPGTVLGVTTRGYCQKSDAGTRNVAVQLKSGSTTVQSPSTALNTTFGWIYRTDLTDPATSAAWTATGVNNAQIGAQVTA